MRIHSMRTPVQREQNYALESMVNEVAAAVGADPIDYRIRHTTDDRLVNSLARTPWAGTVMRLADVP